MLFILSFNTARLLFFFLSFLMVCASTDLWSMCVSNFFFFPHPGDQSQTFLKAHSPCWALLCTSHSGRVSEYLLVFASHAKYFTPCDSEFVHTVFMLLHVSSSFSLDRGSYSKGSPQIRIDRDLEESSFFWKKGSETDLWTNYPKIYSTTCTIWQT